MSQHLTPYAAYKDSGVPRLGAIPTHWQTKPLKHCVRINERTLPENTPLDYEFRYLDIGAVGTGFLIEPPQQFRFVNAPSRARRILRQGDTIISTVRTYLKAVYFIAEDWKDLVASTGFAVLSPGHKLYPKYLSFLVQSDPFTNRVSADSVGIAYPAIAETKLAAFHIAIPPLDEQVAIVHYLDHIDGRISRFIAAKRRLIALLNEQKQVIIHRAVTCGLDPNVRLKPSGVEWLGDVPEHWEVTRLKYLFNEVDIRSTTGTETLLSLRMYQGLVPHNDVSNTPIESNALIGFKSVAPGQLVMNRMREAIGMFGVAPQTGVVSPDYAVLEPNDNVDPYYFVHLFKTRSAGTVFRLESKGLGTGSSGFMRLYTDRFGVIKVPLPPLSEQRAIVSGITDQTQEIESTVRQVEREIDLIREYRTRLIADVVTGKLDVRATAANLPDEIEPSELYESLEEADESFEEDEAEAALMEAEV